MIVVDVGSAFQQHEESTYKLATRFRPDALFAFDPQNPPSVPEHFGRITTIFRSHLAAWTEDGELPWEGYGISAGTPLSGQGRAKKVECFNLPAFLRALSRPLILKLDCEGAEFPILHALVATGGDERLDLLLVEWHEGTRKGKDFYGHGWAEMGRPDLRCPVEEWA